jgi:hypothetical protein
MALFIWPPNQTVITGVATEATLLAVKGDTATLVTQTDGIEASLTSLNAKDFATQTTLAAVAIDVGILKDKDFATEGTLSNIQIDGSQTAANTASIAVDTAALALKDFATASNQAITNGKLDSILAKQAGSLITAVHDCIVPDETGLTSNVYRYKTGGVAGTTVQTLTINYTDATKTIASSYVRT